MSFAGFERDDDGRLVIATGDGGTLSMEAGFLRDENGALVVVGPEGEPLPALDEIAEVDTDGTLGANSDEKVASEKATRNFVLDRTPWNYRDHGFNACSVDDPATLQTNMKPEAGKPIYTKVPVRRTTNFSTVRTIIAAAGTGATALENCYLAVFDSTGARLGVSADQKTAWATGGEKAVAIVADSGKSLTVEGSQTAFVWVALLVGTQSTTNVEFATMANSSGRVNFGMAANGVPLRVATLGTGKTALPSSIVPAELTTNGNGPIGFGAT